jgi:hypothetical protein
MPLILIAPAFVAAAMDERRTRTRDDVQAVPDGNIIRSIRSGDPSMSYRRGRNGWLTLENRPVLVE